VRVATQCSFDITSNVDLQEVDNALNQARKEVAQRYDFKGSKASIDFDPKESKLVLVADDDFKLNALWEVVQTRLVRRNVPVKNLTRGPALPASNSTVRQDIALQQGIPSEKAKDIVKFIKDAKLKKVQASIQGDQLRVTSPSRDDLQEAMRVLREQESTSLWRRLKRLLSLLLQLALLALLLFASSFLNTIRRRELYPRSMRLVISVLAIVCITMSIRRFWRADHSKRWHYTVFGTAVICFLLVLVVQDLTEIIREVVS